MTENAPTGLAYRRAPALTLRWATEADAEDLRSLAALDEDCVPPAPLLLGFVGEELWSAVSLSTGAAIADPFKPSAEVTALVRERGRQLTVTPGRGENSGLRLGLGKRANLLRLRLALRVPGA